MFKSWTDFSHSWTKKTKLIARVFLELQKFASIKWKKERQITYKLRYGFHVIIILFCWSLEFPYSIPVYIFIWNLYAFNGIQWMQYMWDKVLFISIRIFTTFVISGIILAIHIEILHIPMVKLIKTTNSNRLWWEKKDTNFDEFFSIFIGIWHVFSSKNQTLLPINCLHTRAYLVDVN